ncbi:hypothetical protein BDB00DRAFT_826077 [Zychaea mexicana]|uniref:uncharacterized protein n=1 Tax=Zychaea mexicana TaxID=64656 RepID=UPI0022FEF5D2|nr:uncharacterized protein BDB00DRAFT_826077 [Zychaea mexicana]KAI9492899.1 hypothetical protein BDB00DRAFT_826077 [Zychaea mexicana]
MVQYSEAFLTTRPKDGLDIVQEHMKAGRTIDEEFAHYFKERAFIEDQYAKSLVKASKRLFVMDKGSLGTFAPVWDLLFNEFTEISTAHAMLSFKIAEEIEKPLRSPPSSEHGKVKAAEATFHRMSKDYEEHARKSKDKGTLFKRGNKDSSKRGLENAASMWYKDGPAFLKHHQQLEEARLQRLKSLVEKFEQIQTDQMLKRMEIANITMSAATAYDVPNEIDEFCKTRGRNLQKATPSNDLQRPSHGDRQGSGSIVTSSTTTTTTSSPGGSPRPAQKTSRVKSAFSLRRKTRNGSALRLPDTNAFGPIDEESNANGGAQHVQRPPSPSNSRGSYHVPRSENERNVSSPSPQPQSQSVASTHSVEQSSFQAQTNQSPSVDAEGYSVPPPDRSEYSAALNDNNSGFDGESTSDSQRFKIDIHNDAIDTGNKQEADATLTRVASLLRDKTPSVSRRPRGRRENIRSMQIESGLYSNQGSQVFKNDEPMGSSTVSSTATTPTHPFHQNSFEVSTPTSASSVSHSPAMSHESPSQLRSLSETGGQQPQIHASIVELTERDPQAGNDGPIQIHGQIKLVYNGPPSPPTAPLLVRLGHLGQEATFSANPQYVEPYNNEPDMYALKVEAFEGRRRQPVPCFQYQLQTSVVDLPIQLKPAWKCTDDTTYLIVNYTTNPAQCVPPKSQFAVCVKFDKVPVTHVQSTPQGAWDTGKRQLTWMTDAIVTQEGSQKQPRLLAKFNTAEKGSPVPTILKYYLKDTLMTNMSIEAVPASGSTLQVKQVQTVVRSDRIAFA